MPKDDTTKTIIVAFVPVLHQGYLNLFDAYPDIDSIYLIDVATYSSDDTEYIRKDLRKLKPTDVQKILIGLGKFKSVEILNDKNLGTIDQAGTKIIMPDEDVSNLVKTKFKNANVELYNIFLRWDRRSLSHINVEQEDQAVTSRLQDIQHMQKALEVAGMSPDIWRRVGAALVQDDEIIDFACNSGEPHQHSPWMEGDPRNAFNRGVGIEMSVFTHAEAILIARAAKNGISLKGASLYCTDYPCPACAKLVAHSGIKNLYFKDGYAVLDGQRVLDEHGVKISKVSIVEPEDKTPEVWVPYKKS